MVIPKKMLKLLTEYRDTYGTWYWDQDQGSWDDDVKSGRAHKKAEEALLKYLRGYCNQSKSLRKVKPVPIFDDGV